MPNKIYVANEQTLQTVKTDVNGLHTKMGQTSDASTSSTVFGKLNGIATKISDLLAPIIQKIGEPSDTSSKQTVFGTIKDVKENIGTTTNLIKLGSIKSMQRIDVAATLDNKEMVTYSYYTSEAKYADITISPVNPNKTIVLFDSKVPNDTGSFNGGAKLTSNNNVRVYGDYVKGTRPSYGEITIIGIVGVLQVVEFY